MKRIEWLSPRTATEEPCPVCKASNSELILRAEDYRRTQLFHELALCNACSSLHYVDSSPDSKSEHYEADALFPNATKLALELQTGMQLFVDLLDRIPPERFTNYLEVGCGAGTAVDFVQSYWGKEAVGVEPSEYGKAGASQLGIQIYTDYLENIQELAERKFGVVSSFEVIEHTYDPAGFIDTLKRWMQPDGILLLTTPNAEFIDRKHTVQQVYPALFPGEHKVIFSADRLELLLREAGFAHVVSASIDQQLIYFASRAPFELKSKADPDVFFLYLGKRLEAFAAAGEERYVVGAFLFRLVADRVGKGLFEKATPYVPKLLACLGITDDQAVETFVQKAKTGAQQSSLNAYGDRLPYFTGTAMYFLAMFFWKQEKNADKAHSFFMAAVEIIGIERAIEPIIFRWPVSLLPQCRYLAGVTALQSKRYRRASELLQLASLDPDLVFHQRKKAKKMLRACRWKKLWSKQ